MPVEYRYHPELRCLLFRLTNHFSLAEFQEAIDRAKSDPDVPPMHLRFSDMRPISGKPEPGDVERMASLANALDALKPPERAAILADRDVYFGLARMYHAHRDGQQDRISVFRDYEEARQWLGLPDTLGDVFDGEEGWK